MNILLIGSGGREDAVARKIVEQDNLYSVITNENPSIINLSQRYMKYDKNNYNEIIKFSNEYKIDIAFVSPDEILNTELVNILRGNHIPVASPTKNAAMIETSKEYMRYIMDKYRIKGNIENKVIDSYDDLNKFFGGNNGEYAIKPLGLTGGKGVKVMGLQLKSKDEAIKYAG